MTEANPYASPIADLAPAGDDTSYPRFLACSGRIGRLRYFVYNTAITLLGYGVILALALTTQSTGSAAANGIVGIAAVFLYGFVLIYTFGFARRRLNDLDKTGWLCALFLVPVVNFGLGLYLLFAAGTDGSNRFGARPTENTGGLVAAAWALPAIVVVAFVAVFAGQV